MISHRTRSQTKSSNVPTSRLGRIAKSCLSLYLLAAIFYTFYSFFILPAASYASGGRLSSPSSSAKLDDLKQNLAALNNSGVGTPSKNRHAALETAGVKASDVRNEDNSDPVWAAAEAAEKRGKKSKAKDGVYKRPEVLIDGLELTHRRLHGFEGVDWDKDKMVWHHPEAEVAHSGPTAEGAVGIYESREGKDPLSISEDHFLSLSFSSSLQPSKVIPYYYRASDPDRLDFNKQDITITTLVTSNRFTVFERLVERYQGKITSRSSYRFVADSESLLRSCFGDSSRL